MALFALAWAIAGSGVLAPVRPVVLTVAVAITSVVLIVTWKLRPTQDAQIRQLRDHWWRDFQIVGAAQVPAIALVIAGGIWAGAPALIPAAVALVVAVHFIPLRHIFRTPMYSATAGGLGFVAVVGLASFWFLGPETSVAVATLGSAVVLWGTAALIAFSPTRLDDGA